MNMANILTIDVEDYFQVENFKKTVKYSDWDKHELRVVANTEKILFLLAQAGASATFFILGWIAERVPKLVKKISAQGHEVASHGYAHELIYRQTQNEFREDLRRSKEILEGITGKKVFGYRAPTYSLTKECLWAIDVLVEEDFRYDSSIFPLRRKRGGLTDAPRFLHHYHVNGKTLTEIPVTTNKILGQTVSVAGGGYFRLFPLSLIKWSIRDVNKQGHPAVIYLHPWELDPKQPRIKSGAGAAFKHYVNLATTEKKLKNLLNEFTFTTFQEYLKSIEVNTP